MDAVIWRGTVPGAFEWAVATRPLRGQQVSGDAYLVRPLPDGALIAVVDGLGHGPQAEEAARAALGALERDPSRPVDVLVRACHEALHRSRGVVMSVASFDAVAGRLTWLGVGNVEGALVKGRGARERLFLWGGVVGYSFGTLRPATVPVACGDLLVLTTDGIASSVFDELSNAYAAELFVQRAFARHARDSDDALILAARFTGAK